MERHFDIQLEELKSCIIKMCSLVDEQVENAIKVVETEDFELAKLVIDGDYLVDKYDVKIDKICQKIIALNQPVAMDLRLIMGALTINSNLERIGDIAVNVVENFLGYLKSKPLFYDRIKFAEMSRLVTGMITNSINAFIQADAELAERVIKSDEILDALNKENHKVITDIMKESKDNIEPGVACLIMSRQLERMGDHTTNIAEDVYFIVKARMIKHNFNGTAIDFELAEEE